MTAAHLVSLTLLSLLSPLALTAPGAAEVEKAADAAALAVDGLMVTCPPALQKAAPLARCVNSDLSVGATRRAISASPLKLYGAWRAESGDRVYNWVRTDSGYLNVGVQGRDNNAALVILAPSQTARPQAATPAPAPAPAPSTPPAQTASTPRPRVKIPPFQRTLRLTQPRMFGEDIRTLQYRLMDVSGVDRGQGGDGWFGPVTEANVILFQLANGLPATGVVTTQTWNTLFSQGAKGYDASQAPALAKRRR